MNGRARARQSGYTLVEVMMSLTILAIGGAGIFALQSVAVTGNMDANDLTAATNIARGWVEHIKMDATRWNSFGPNPPSDIGDTQILSTLGAAWGALTVNPQRSDGGVAANGRYCAHARVRPPAAPLVGVVPPVAGLQLDVRVWWFKGQFANRTPYPNCGAAQAAAMGADLQQFHWVYVSTLLVPHTLN